MVNGEFVDEADSDAEYDNDDTGDEHRPRGAVRNGSNASRLLATIIGVAVLGALAVGGAQWVSQDRDVVPEVNGWSAVVTADRMSGALTLWSPSLELLATANHGERIAAVLDGGGVSAVVLPDSVIVEPFDLLPTIMPIPSGHRVRALSTSNDLTVVIGNDAGGNLVIITDRAGARPSVIDLGAITGEPNPRYFPADIEHDLNGTLFAIADTVNFQTVLVSPDSEQPVYLPDLALAVHPNLVVTSQTVGDRAEIGLFDPNGDRIRTISTPAVRGGTISADGERFIFVTRDGRVMRVRRTSNDLEDLGGLDMPDLEVVTDVTPVVGGSRLWVRSAHSAAVVALDGQVLGRWVGTGDITNETLTMSSRCAIVEADGVSRLVDLINGRELADVSGLVGISQSDDGCLLTAIRSSTQSTVLVGRFNVVDLVGRRVLAMAPDSSAVILTSESGPVLLDIKDLAIALSGGSAASAQRIETGDDLYVIVSGFIDTGVVVDG